MTSLNPILRNGIVIAVLLIGLAALSWRFPYGVDINAAPLLLYIGLALVAGGAWFLLPRLITKTPPSRGGLWMVLVIGIVMRGAMFFSTPVLEDDSYRYLWDGAVVAHGVNPYEFSPSEAAPQTLLDSDSQLEVEGGLKTLQQLARENAEPHSRINYPFVSTIYPPLTQAAFAIAHIIDPFGITGWRLILLVADFVTMAILVVLLAAHGRNPLWAALYWWNPIVILQGFGAGHMDIVVLPFLLGALLLAHRERRGWAGLALACAAGVKLWPLILFPLLARPILFRPIRLCGMIVFFIIATAMLLAPQLWHVLHPDAGLSAYASDWRTHAFLFSLLEDGIFRFVDDPGQVTRLVVAVLIITLTMYLALRFANDPEHLPVLVTIVVASLIFFSPTGYPWYLIWLAPFLAFAPNLGLMGLMVTAPLYWLRFQLGDENPMYQWGVVPIAFGLPLLLLALSFRNKEQQDDFSRDYPSTK